MAVLARVRAGVGYGLEVARFVVVEPFTCRLGRHKPVTLSLPEPRTLCVRCAEPCRAR